MKVFVMEDGWYRAETDCHPFMSVEGESEKVVTDIITRFSMWYSERAVSLPPPEIKEGLLIDSLPALEQKIKKDFYQSAAKGGPITDHRN
jgi:hypothetical protein